MRGVGRSFSDAAAVAQPSIAGRATNIRHRINDTLQKRASVRHVREQLTMGVMNIGPDRGRAATHGRVRRSLGARHAVITPQRGVAMIVAAVSAAVILFGGHSGITMVTVLIGMCLLGIIGHNA